MEDAQENASFADAHTFDPYASAPQQPVYPVYSMAPGEFDAQATFASAPQEQQGEPIYPTAVNGLVSVEEFQAQPQLWAQYLARNQLQARLNYST